MPSSKDPLSTVAPGPGKLPAGVVSTSALLLGVGGGGSGGGAALYAHIHNPTDAHMASAIGVDLFDPQTGLPLLSSVGGPIDGESVLDFIAQTKDLLPDRPNRLGILASGSNPNTGVSSWDSWSDSVAQAGAYTDGTNAVFTHFVTADGSSNPTLTGILYPADRGVYAIYRSTTGSFLTPGTTTLYAALWLGSTASQPAALTCPSADFDGSVRPTGQMDYTAANAGLDWVTLINRLPYLKDYTGTGAPYDNYAANFTAYQLAEYAFPLPAAVSGTNDSWLIVHWKEGYAVSDASIAPLALSTNFLVGNAYSVVGTNFDDIPADLEGLPSLNRQNVYQDALSATIPSLASWSLTSLGFPSTVFVSGVQHYDNVAPLSWASDLRVDDLVGNAWLPGKLSGAELPSNFVTTQDMLEINYEDFGASPFGRAYYDLHKTGVGGTYTMVAAPAPTDQVQDLQFAMGFMTPVAFTPALGQAHLKVNMHRPFASVTTAQAEVWMFNSWPQTGGATDSSEVFDSFRDERYRYTSSFAFATPMKVEPQVADKYDSTAVLVSGGQGDLQVVGDLLVYPTVDYSVFHPAGNPDYAAVFAGDPPTAFRTYLRAFDTGMPRSTGRIRLRGLAYAAFKAATYSADIVADHPGGAGIFVAVPGASSQLDLGRAKGDPDLSFDKALRGCQVGVEENGSEVIVTYDTTAFTGNNTFGEYPIAIFIAIFKTAGSGLSIDEIEWLAP